MTPDDAAGLGLRWPDYSAPCLAAVLPAMAGSLGVDVPWEGPETVVRDLALASARRHCLLLVDGLGAMALAERAGHAPTLRRAAGRRLPVGFPATTVASLAALGTGRAPGSTGLAGYALRSAPGKPPRQLVGWQTSVAPEVWQRVPTVFERLGAAGVPSVFVGEERFAGSGLTRAVLRGAEHRGADSSEEVADRAVAALREPGPGLVYAYWGALDKTGHREGWTSPAWAAALTELDALAAAIARGAPSDTAVHLVADHGMVDVDTSRHIDLAAEPSLAAGVASLGGEPRAAHVYTDPGADPVDVAARWADALGSRAWVATRTEAIAAGLFGQVDAATAPRLGDVVVAMTGRWTVVDSARQPAGMLQMIGNHGSLTRAEALVPFLRLA